MVSVDTVLDLLQEDTRRYALYYLDSQDAPVRVEELAEAVAEMESDSETVEEAAVAAYEVELRHGDLPKVTEAEFVEYDAEAGVVRLTGEPPTFEAILSVAEVLERPA
jgi:hypothetical protein